MAITPVGSPTHKTRTSFSATTTQLRTGVTAGNLLVVPIAYFHGDGRTITVTSSPTNTWTEYATAAGDANSHIEIWYAQNVASGDTTLTFTWSAGANNGELEGDILEFSSAATTNAADATVTNSGTSTGPSAASGTLAQADEVIIAIASHTGADTTWTPDGDYTQISENEDNDTGQTYNSQYRVVASTTSDTANWTLGASRTWFAALASFKGAAGGGTTEELSVAGAIALAGTAVKQAGKPVAGVATPGGTVQRQSAKLVAGSLGLAGVRQLLGLRSLAGSLDISGTVASLKVGLLSVAGGLGLSGTVTSLRTTFASLAGALGISGTVGKQGQTTVAGSLGLSGTVDSFVGFTVALAGALGLSGTVTRQVTRQLVGALALSGTVQRQVAHLVAGALTVSGTIGLQTLAGGAVRVIRRLLTLLIGS